ncbi:acetolactate synthase catalytic subunit [Thermoplasmatales archaeon]|nr:acetolactate synthase catalytic subunit [Thermoplasmatales archaeon]
MRGSDAILEMMEKYGVQTVFGLIGETSFPLYESWEKYDKIRHVLVRDERNAAIMADGYSRSGQKPGICEVPGVGASYTLPGIIEAYNSGTPMVVLSSDISLSSEKKDYLTEYDKSGMFRQITKEYISVNDGKDIPRLLRRAFRIATSGRMGPVFVRFPMNTYIDQVPEQELYAQTVFAKYPSVRAAPGEELLVAALNMIRKSTSPVIVAGQGVLLSHAEAELQEFSDRLGIPVATTISGKGSVSELGELSLGVIGSRGGTDFSNGVLSASDLVFYVGTNADSASTSEWKNPPQFATGRKIIHLDVSEFELGNNYPTDLFLYGDAKLTLSIMNRIAARGNSMKWNRSSLIQKRKDSIEYQNKLGERKLHTVNPVRLVKALQDLVPEDSVIAGDPGVGTIYSSAYFRVSKPGRKFLFNYAVGGLGFSLPAAIGAHYATGKTTFSMTTDGSFGFVEGELETLKRYEPDVKVIIVNNGSFGWIRATMMALYDRIVGETEFKQVDFSGLAKAHGIPYDVIVNDGELNEKIKGSMKEKGPYILEIVTEPEDKIVPPVPEWRSITERHNVEYLG